MIRAAGILYVAPNGHVLLVHRTDGQGWAFPGGGVEDGESAEEAARRELLEETGLEYDGALTLWTRRVQTSPMPIDAPAGTAAQAVDFTTFLARGKEFTPKLNAEHDAYQWVDREFALNSPLLHPGVPIALRRFDMDELGIAQAIQAGELTSPQRYHNLMLVALRITGTGYSYRPLINEYVYRDPAIWLTPECLNRCNGLAVILEHPEGNKLDTEEFRDRTVGAIFLPYIQGDEVWGIGKILDMPAAKMLEEEEMSTSPGVIFTKAEEAASRIVTENGTVLLVEGKPRLIDHLALLPGYPGVWDKGGPLAGVSSIDTEARADSAAVPSAMDVILNHIKVDQISRLASRL